ncbi:MAG: hypothetical protein KIS96_15045 [Bauldia sp.]|nr:hypothetical protein [Bauldia sp.]
MPSWKRLTLAVHSVLVLGMVVVDPTEAHRPPELRETPRIAVIAAITGDA